MFPSPLGHTGNTRLVATCPRCSCLALETSTSYSGASLSLPAPDSWVCSRQPAGPGWSLEGCADPCAQRQPPQGTSRPVLSRTSRKQPHIATKTATN